MKEYEPLIRRILTRLESPADPRRIAAKLAEIAPKLQALRVRPEVALGVAARALCLETAPRARPPDEPDELAADLQSALQELPPRDRLLFAKRYMDAKPLAQVAGPGAIRRILRKIDASLALDRSPCPSDADLLGLQGNVLESPDQTRVESHVESCIDCSERARGFRAAVERLRLTLSPDCPDLLTLLSQLAGSRLVAHLADCADCRLKVEELAPPRRFLWPALLGGMALLAMAALIVWPRPRHEPAAVIEEVRGRVEQGDGEAWEPVMAGHELRGGLALRLAEPAAEARLTLPDRSELLLSRQAAIQVGLDADAHRVKVFSGAVSFKAGGNVVFQVGAHEIRPSEVSIGRLDFGTGPEPRVEVYRGRVIVMSAGQRVAVEPDWTILLNPAGTVTGPLLTLSRPPEVAARWPEAADGILRQDFESTPEGARPEDWIWPKAESGSVERNGGNLIFTFPQGGGPALFGVLSGRRSVLQAEVRISSGGRLLAGMQTGYGHALEFAEGQVRILRVRWIVGAQGRAPFQTFEQRLAASEPAAAREGEWYGVAVEINESVAGRTIRARWWPLGRPAEIAELEAVDRAYRLEAVAQAQMGVWALGAGPFAVDNLFWR